MAPIMNLLTDLRGNMERMVERDNLQIMWQFDVHCNQSVQLFGNMGGG